MPRPWSWSRGSSLGLGLEGQCLGLGLGLEDQCLSLGLGLDSYCLVNIIG